MSVTALTDMPGNTGNPSTQPLSKRATDKLSLYPIVAGDIIIPIDNPYRLSDSEHTQLLDRIRQFNMVIYQCPKNSFSKEAVKSLGAQLGLSRIDQNHCADKTSVSSLQALTSTDRRPYIPYTDRPLGWHTDGAYNSEVTAIHAFILHCVRPAVEGGINAFLDPDIAYYLLTENEPQYAAMLSHPAAFTIPAHKTADKELRPAVTNSVFSVSPLTMKLHMRYSSRQKNIEWNAVPRMKDAVAALSRTIESAGLYTLKHKLEPGQGVICNNVLHRRSGFMDGSTRQQTRLFYRARYYDRIG